MDYSKQIDKLREYKDFEARGDKEFLFHQDIEARVLWAFYRPSGSCERQLQDSAIDVAIMGFNQSKLPPLKRFTLVNSAIFETAELRHKSRNMTRMLFRSLVDDDFNELNQVLELYPVFYPLACEQIISGRMLNESYPDLEALSIFMKNGAKFIDEKVLQAIFAKLQPIEMQSDFDEIVEILQTKNLHEGVRAYYKQALQLYIDGSDLHLLQKKVLEKKLDFLNNKKS